MLALAVFKLPASAEPYGGISVLKRDESRSSTANHQCDGERKWTAIYSANRSLINDNSDSLSAGINRRQNPHRLQLQSH
jgi:hypothetical protein